MSKYFFRIVLTGVIALLVFGLGACGVGKVKELAKEDAFNLYIEAVQKMFGSEGISFDHEVEQITNNENETGSVSTFVYHYAWNEGGDFPDMKFEAEGKKNGEVYDAGTLYYKDGVTYNALGTPAFKHTKDTFGSMDLVGGMIPIFFTKMQYLQRKRVYDIKIDFSKKT